MNIKMAFKFSFCIALSFSLVKGMEQSVTSNFLDKTFGNNGIVTTDFGRHSGTYNREAASIHVKIQPDQKILIIGDAYIHHPYSPGDNNHPHSSFALARYNPDGTLDTSFGIDGKVILPLSRVDSFGIDFALQEDGKIVVIGRSFDRGDYYPDAILARLNHDGTIDSSFGIDGVILDENREGEISQFWRVAIQDDGKIIAVGCKGSKRQKYIVDHNAFFVARYNIDGTSDTSFGNNGRIETRLMVHNFQKSRTQARETDYANGICLQSDGKIIVVGGAGDASKMEIIKNSYNDDCALVRYETSGEFDTSFGKDKNGMVVTSVSNKDNCFYDVIVQPDGKIVAIGLSQNPSTDKYEFLIARYLNDGTLDSSFGEHHNGLVLSALGTGDARAKNVILQDDGKILVTGEVTWKNHTKFTVVRYTTDGLLDTTFGENGILVTLVGQADDKSFALAMQDDGKLVVVGNSFDGKQYNFALVRYNCFD